MRLIDGDKLRIVVEESLENNLHKDWKVRVNHKNEHFHFLKLINLMPFEDAEIVVHAHCVINWLGDCHCSNCNGYIDYTSKYCNWCGAKLDEQEEREE